MINYGMYDMDSIADDKVKDDKTVGLNVDR